MQNIRYVVVDRGRNYISFITRKKKTTSARTRKMAKLNAPKVVIYGMSEKDYKKLCSVSAKLYTKNSATEEGGLRRRLIRNAIKGAFQTQIAKGRACFNHNVDKNREE